MNPFASNPHSIAIKRYLFEVLKERYGRNEKYIDRMAAATLVQEDYEALGSLVVDIFEAGFLRAVDQYKEQMSKMGLKVDVVPDSPPSSGKRIFGDS
jgi:hypothetical protein